VNIFVMCMNCGEEVKVAVESLRWIRCPRCHRAINLDRCPKKVALPTEISERGISFEDAVSRVHTR